MQNPSTSNHAPVILLFFHSIFITGKQSQKQQWLRLRPPRKMPALLYLSPARTATDIHRYLSVLRLYGMHAYEVDKGHNMAPNIVRIRHERTCIRYIYIHDMSAYCQAASLSKFRHCCIIGHQDVRGSGTRLFVMKHACIKKKILKAVMSYRSYITVVKR